MEVPQDPLTGAMGEPARVTVIIPHLRGRELLLELLADLRREVEAADGAVEVLLVDNASTDGSREAVEREHPWVRILRLPGNEGYAGACNRGVEASEGAWVWLMNDDLRLQPGVLAELLGVAESAEDVAAVQPKILSLHDPRRFDYAGGAGGLIDRFGYPFAYGRIGGVLEEDRGQYDEVREIFWASGTACLWRREALRRIGHLDESFFAHMEEVDLAWRAWISGWRILSAPAAVVHHLGGGTLSYTAWRKMYLNHRNSLVTLVKNRQAGALSWLLPARLFLDLGIGLAETAGGRPQRLAAVLAGWGSFLLHLPRWVRSRREVQALRRRSDNDLSSVVYPGCILFAYLRGVRRVEELAGLR